MNHWTPFSIYIIDNKWLLLKIKWLLLKNKWLLFIESSHLLKRIRLICCRKFGRYSKNDYLCVTERIKCRNDKKNNYICHTAADDIQRISTTV